jgi:hypothetical protein
MTSVQLRTMTDAEVEDVWWSPATNEQLKAMTISEVTEEAWWSAAKRFPWRWSRMTTRDFPVLLVNDTTHTLMQRVKVGGTNWRGTALKPREVAQVVKRLRHIRRLSARGKTVVDRLTAQLEYCRRFGVCLVQDGPDRRCRDRIAVHECFHLFQYRNGLHRRPTPKALLEHPATSKAIPSLRTQYDVGNAANVVVEMAAYIFSGDHAYIGLRRREAEDWLSDYFRQYAVDSRRLGPIKKAVHAIRSIHR